MKSDSCRICGETLEVKKKCDICNQANQFFCHSCGHETEEQIHNQCILASFSHTLLNLK